MIDAREPPALELLSHTFRQVLANTVFYAVRGGKAVIAPA